MAQLLASIYAESGDTGRARAIFGELMQRCQSCHRRVDPMVKHDYAELSFVEGQRDTRLLELYLSLAQEVPEQAGLYFRRVSAIYADQGHMGEAQRFRALAERSMSR